MFLSVLSLFVAIGAGAWSFRALGQEGPGSAVSRLALDRWFYILADDDRGKWGDFDQPAWLRYFGLAIGDVTGGRMLSYAATNMGVVAAENAFGESSKFQASLVPRGIFTYPEAAAVGLTEE